MAYRNNRSNRSNRNNNYHRSSHSRGASYIWDVSWYDSWSSSHKKRRGFANKQQALIFMTKLRSQDKVMVRLEKWSG